MGATVSIEPLGTFEVPDGDVYTFPSGLPGFPQCKRFALVERPKFAPFLWMVSLDQPDLAFVVIDPEPFFNGYRPRLAQEDLEVVGLTGKEGLVLLAIVTVPADATKTTANLRGPVILNPATRTGRQAILAGQEYSTRQPLLAGVESGGGSWTPVAAERNVGAPQSQGRRDRSAGPDS